MHYSKICNSNMAQRRSQNQEICTTSKVSWWSHFAILFLIMSVLKAHLAAASDTIYPGQSLAWNQTLTSKSGIFEMGFFRPGKSHHYNLGIWYKMIAEFTVLWEKDLTYLGSEPGPIALELSNDGLLTFEEETGTWLPGAKLLLGFNTLTNETKTNFLYSSNRRFSAELEVEENGTGSLVLCNSEYSYTYYYQTIYVGNLSWGELANQYINVSYVSNENESYFIYSVVSPYKFARIIFNDFGELTIYVWAEDLHQWNLVSKAPQQRCEIWGFCGEYGICNQQNVPLCTCPIGFRPRNSSNWDLYDYKEGCERREPLQCSDDKFLTIPNMRFPESSHYLAVKNVEECKRNCLSSCDCVAYSYNNECLIYKGTLINLRLPFDNELGGDLHIRISASELAGSKTKKSKKAAWVIGVPVVLILLTGIVLAIIWRGHYIGVLEEVEFSLILFNYGKLLFEIVSGRRNMDMLDGDDEEEMCNYFPARVAIAINKGEDLLTLLDHKLEGNAIMEELTRACKVACWCIQDDPRDRPTMGQVVQILEGVMQVDVPQIPLYFRRLLENPMVVIVSQEIETLLQVHIDGHKVLSLTVFTISALFVLHHRKYMIVL
ncbi:hypothetical protein CMV_015210 [Castanea mollissima]|uniref:Apple domain-containing protein n=1 Tax=Castanea mollissima TaxID=60419 RepID=A0A8J4QW07_9ROSI|nr:hypothetical protein CMV_015210 [Castanea mollissima]